MKKHKLLRFRMWLIRKLGGYTEQYVIEPIHLHSPKHETLKCEQHIDDYMLNSVMSEEYLLNFIKTKMSHLMAEKILTDNLCDFKMENNYMFGNGKVARLTVKIIPPLSQEMQEEIYAAQMPYPIINH